MTGVGQQRESERPFAVRRDFFAEAATLLVRINADRQQADLLAGLEERSELGKLPGTVGSPVAAVEDQHQRSFFPLR